jgi:predicted RNase H-like HicB family nuclease
MGPAEYLNRPYGRVVIPESDGTFRAEIIEFPGCIAVGDTAAEALANLEGVAESWLEATLAKGQRISEPMENGGFSGKLVLRLPKTLHKKAAYMAARDGVSLNLFIISSVAQQVGRSFVATIGQPLSFHTIANVQISSFQPTGTIGLLETAGAHGPALVGTFTHGPALVGTFTRGRIMPGTGLALEDAHGRG